MELGADPWIEYDGEVLKVNKKQQDQALHVDLSGSLDHEEDLETHIGEVPASVTQVLIKCSQIVRINSAGTRTWIRYFQSLRAQGKALRFIGCSSILVTQMNLFVNFVELKEVESISLPFLCTGCKKELVSIFPIEDLRKLNFKIPSFPCSFCGKQANFDEEKEYFKFLKS